MNKIKITLPVIFALLASSVFAYDTGTKEEVNFLNVGVEAYKSEHKETGGPTNERKDKGTFEGGFLKFTTYKPLGPFSDNTNSFFTFEIRYAQSNDVDREQNPITYFGFEAVPARAPGTLDPEDPGFGGIPAGVPLVIMDDEHCDPDTNLCSRTATFPSYAPLTEATRKQYVIEARGLGGTKLLKTQNWDIEGFLGLGLRYHKDKTDDSISLTEQQIATTYVYMPIGLSTQLHGAGFRLKIIGEFDWLFLANKSNSAKVAFAMNSNYIDDYTGDVYWGQGLYSYDRVESSSNGIGAKLAADLEIDAGPIGITFSPYFKYWKVNKYSEQPLYTTWNGSTHHWIDWESGRDLTISYPKSTTTEYGFQISLLF